MMVEPVILTTIVGIVAALIGGGGVAALIKSRSEARTGDAGILISRERAKVEITHLLQQITKEALEEMQARMTEQDERHASQLEQVRAGAAEEASRLRKRIESLEERLSEAVQMVGRLWHTGVWADGQRPRLSAWLYEQIHQGGGEES